MSRPYRPAVGLTGRVGSPHVLLPASRVVGSITVDHALTLFPGDIHPHDMRILAEVELASRHAVLVAEREGIAGGHDDLVVVVTAGADFHLQEAVMFAAVDELVAVPDLGNIAVGAPVSCLSFFGKQVEGHVHGARGVSGSAEAVSG